MSELTEDEKVAQFWDALARLIGEVAPEAEEAGVGISILLGEDGRIEVMPDPAVPAGLEQYRLL